MTTKCVDATTKRPQGLLCCSTVLTIRLIVDHSYNNRVIKTLRAVYS